MARNSGSSGMAIQTPVTVIIAISRKLFHFVRSFKESAVVGSPRSAARLTRAAVFAARPAGTGGPMLTSRVLLSGRYMLDERIGAGGHSEVWRAADLTLARLVAVKLLYAGFAQHADALARFRAEARHAARLSHENIAR